MSVQNKIKHWNASERPREKLSLYGRRVLSDVELIAIVLGTGNKEESAIDLSRNLLSIYDNDLVALGNSSSTELCKHKGIGKAKAARIIAAMELGRRRSSIRIKDRPVLRSSLQVYQYLKHTFQDLRHEESWAIFLDPACKVIQKQLIGSGGNDFTPVDIKLVFRYAVECGARMVIIAHNHPSGNLNASRADIILTERLVKAGNLLDIEVSDHLIFTDNSYMSFRDEGLIHA